MADPRNFFYNQDQRYREQHTTRDDFVSFAEANANYCYQLSLWWWNVYNQQHSLSQSWNTQNCECVENDLITDGACDCCQNDVGFEYECDTQGHGMDTCKNCPQPEHYNSPYWHTLHDERSRSYGNQTGGMFSQNDNINNGYGNDNNTDEIGEEDDDDCNSKYHEYDDVDEDSDTNMEVDDNFRKFLEQSEKHRQERERSKFFFHLVVRGHHSTVPLKMTAWEATWL